jgi:hypothetical protein
MDVPQDIGLKSCSLYVLIENDQGIAFALRRSRKIVRGLKEGLTVTLSRTTLSRSLKSAATPGG